MPVPDEFVLAYDYGRCRAILEGSRQMIKEIREYYCDICKKQTSEDFGSLHFYMHIRDYIGNICTGLNKDYKNICEECCKKLDNFICDLEGVDK